MRSDFSVCLTGQIRSLVFPVVQKRLNDTILNPLHADGFLVVSPEWTRATYLAAQKGQLVRPRYEVEPPAADQADVDAIRAALPSIRSSVVIANDSRLLDVASEHVLSALKRQRDVGNALVDPRERCDGSSSAWQVELCRTRVVNAVRLRLCLALIEDAEAARQRPCRRHTVRTCDSQTTPNPHLTFAPHRAQTR